MSICWSNNLMRNRKGVSGSRLLRDLLELIWWKVLLGMNELKWMNLNDCFFYFFFLLLILAFLFAFFFCSRLLLLSFFIRLIVLCDYLKSQSNELDWGCLIKYRFNFSARHLISSLGLTPNYNMVFLIVKMGGVDVSIINGSQRSLTFIRTWTFFLIV